MVETFIECLLTGNLQILAAERREHCQILILNVPEDSQRSTGVAMEAFIDNQVRAHGARN
jgi:hypothetical protein